MCIFLRISIIFIFICNIDARPISYSGGHTLMHFNDSMKESIYYHYSPTYKFSIGLETMQNKVFSTNETNIRFTYLLITLTLLTFLNQYNHEYDQVNI